MNWPLLIFVVTSSLIMIIFAALITWARWDDLKESWEEDAILYEAHKREREKRKQEREKREKMA